MIRPLPVQVAQPHGKYGECKRYTKREPLANPKVSHLSQESAILERNFRRAEEGICIPWHFEMKFVPGS